MKVKSLCYAVAIILTSLLAYSHCSVLKWSFTENDTALCNDFTRAGFFHRNATRGKQKWVIFLESGSLCYSNETCNRRYFQSYLRDQYSTDYEGQNIFGNFDPETVWDETRSLSPTEIVNPLMTSTYCFRNETQFFSSNSNSNDLSVEGRDVLSSDCTENPTFCKHGHVLIPYCSSDLWLGNEDSTSRQYSSLLKQEPCDCWDQNCFQYNPTSEDLQFTFRGQTIFRSVLETLDSMYNLQGASEIVLVGSSAGGVGVLNSAKWMRQEFQNVNIKIITDSSWFINFRDSVNQEFGAVTENKESSKDSKSSDLVMLLHSNEACSDIRLGYPCCLSAHCLLLEKSPTTKEPYYPQDVPVFVLTSIYDIFLLANALSALAPLADTGITSAGLALQFIITMGEYGGAMNASLIDTDIDATRMDVKLSYYSPQCFQHIYLSTSTLRGSNGLLGNENVEINHKIASFQ